MNLSTPKLSLSPSRCTTAPNHGKAGGASSLAESKGGFEEFFAGLAPRSDPLGSTLAKPGGGASVADAEQESASAAKRLARIGTESELNLKKKKAGDPVVGAMEQMSGAVPPEVFPAAGELPGVTETEGIPGAHAEETATAGASSIGQDSGSPVVTVEASQAVAEQSAEIQSAAESAITSLARQSADEPGRDPRAPVSSPETAPERIASARTDDPTGRPAAPRGKRAENSKSAPAADFAEIEAPRPERERGSKTPLQKNFLTSTDELVVQHDPILGTNVANGGSAMSSAPAAQVLENVFLKNTPGARVDATAADFSAQNPSAAEAPFFTGAQHAIEAVLDAGERFTTEAQRAVKMDFSVSGENLSVHVEMHAGEVRTTFHTASAELRSALAHEWQVLAAGDSGRSQRFADPVFSTGSAATTAQGNGSENQGNHRGQEMNQPRERFEFSPRPGGPGPAHSAALPASSPTSVPLTALRLHTFA
jgi:hypothetical protein